MNRMMKTGHFPPGVRTALWIAVPFLCAFFALGLGRYNIPPAEAARAVASRFTDSVEVPAAVYATIWNVRLPRILLALLVGAGLSAAGCAFQSLFANPLATPDTLGVASGASFGAALGILLGLSTLGIQLTSFLMGGAAVLLTWLSGMGRRGGLNTVVLSGIMIGSLFSALVSLVKYVADSESQLPAITYWLMGSLQAAGYENLLWGAPPIFAGILALVLIRWRMNLLPLSEDEIRSSGVNVTLLRGTVVAAATLMTASCVSLCGQVGWVGLLVPHICRMAFGSDHRVLVPVSVSFGAAFLVIVDTLARTISAADIPISILTAILGAPVFVLLMRKK